MRKSLKALVLLIITMFSFSCQNSAQEIYYKNVIMERGDDSQTDFSKKAVYAINFNEYPVVIRYEVKIGDKESPWEECEPIEVLPNSYYDTCSLSLQRYGLNKNLVLLQTFGEEVKAIRVTHIEKNKTNK